MEPFPDPRSADADGLLAIGGDLSAQRLELAYRNGIFPWYSAGQPILWWSPDPRLVLYPEQIKVSKSMRSSLRKERFRYSFDEAFEEVILACSSVKRKGEIGTWITDEMIAAYLELHEIGIAHSLEVWQEQQLVGGLYGIGLGNAFFGESMFHHKTNASKAALIKLCDWALEQDLLFIDCQVSSAHLISMGAKEIPRSDFLSQLKEATRNPKAISWELDRTSG